LGRGRRVGSDGGKGREGKWKKQRGWGSRRRRPVFSKEQEEGGREEKEEERICPDRQGRSSFCLTKIWAIHEGRFCLPFQNRMSLKAH